MCVSGYVITYHWLSHDSNFQMVLIKVMVQPPPQRKSGIQHKCNLSCHSLSFALHSLSQCASHFG